MKKLFAILFVLAITAALSISAAAAGAGPMEDMDLPEGLTTDEKVELIRQTYLEAGYTDISEDPQTAPQSVDLPQEIYDLAYLDIDQADPMFRGQILEARKAVIYTRSWRADDVIFMNANPLARTIDIVPKFSDVFPGWDLPVEDVQPDTAGEASDAASGVERDQQVSIWYNTYAYIPASSTTALAPSMCTVSAYGTSTNRVNTSIMDLPEGMNTYNVGYSDHRTGKSLAFKMNIVPDFNSSFSYEYSGSQYPEIDVRLSTQGTPGSARVYILKGYDVSRSVIASSGDPAAKSSSDIAKTTREALSRKIRENEIRAEFQLKGHTEIPAVIEPGRKIPAAVMKTACMDIAKADPATKEKILKARNQVIYSYSWTYDGVGITHGVNDEGQKTFTIEPRFEDLFPGWDVPIAK